MCRRALLPLVLFAALAAPAAAAPLPAGDYTATLTGGLVRLGLIEAAVPAGAAQAITVPPGGGDVTWSLGTIALPSAPLAYDGGAFGTVSGTVTPHITGPVTVTLHPSDGSADATASGWMGFSGSWQPPIGGPVAIACTLGSEASPVTLAPSTAKAGAAPFDATTQAIALTDAFPVPALSCTGLSGAILSSVSGLLTNGTGSMRLNGSLVPVPATAAPGGGTSPTVPAPTGTPTGPAATTGLTPSATRCVVPKLVGRTLKAATRRLKAAGCRRGTTKRRAKTRRKRGRVIRQSRKAGTVLPAGTKIGLVVSARKMRPAGA